MKNLLAAIAFLVAFFSLSGLPVSLLIVYKVQHTGQFHGIPMQLGSAIGSAVTFLFAAILFTWLGFFIIKRSSNSLP